MHTLAKPMPPARLTGADLAAERTPVRNQLKTVEAAELWRRFVRDGDRNARDHLIIGYAPLVSFVAAKMGSALPSHVEKADLVSYGLGGLIAAIDRFEPNRGVRFESYAITRVKGAILDELRAIDWLPRSLRALGREIERASVKLENRLQRRPSDGELAAQVGITPGELDDALTAISQSAFIALDARLAKVDTTGDHMTLLDTIPDPDADPSVIVDRAALKDRLAEAVSRLSSREQIVIGLYYYEGLNLREIGDIIGVTESRVSQMHTRAILHLRGIAADCALGDL